MNVKKIAPARSALMTAVLMAIASAMVSYLTVTQWYGPTSPTVTLVLLAFVAAPLAVVLAASDLRDLEALKEQGALPAGAINLGVALVIALAAGMPWKSAATRASLVERGAKLSQGRAAEYALEEASDAVALEACQWIFANGDLALRKATTERLARRPARATACLGVDAEAGSKQLVARQELVRIWAQALMSGAIDADVAGALISGLGAISPTDDVAAAALLTCALGHEEQAYRPLCGDALAGNKMTGERLVQVLERVDEPGLAQVWQTKLVAYSFHQYGLTPEDKKTALQLGLLTPEVRSFAMSRGCALVGDEEAGVEEQFKALATASCDVQGEAIRKAEGLWARVCDAHERSLSKKKRPNPTEVFCAALSEELVDRAVLRAQALVHAAISEQASTLLASSVSSGHVKSGLTYEMMIFKRQLTIKERRMLMQTNPELAMKLHQVAQPSEEDASDFSGQQNADALEMIRTVAPPPEANITPEQRAELARGLEEFKKYQGTIDNAQAEKYLKETTARAQEAQKRSARPAKGDK